MSISRLTSVATACRIAMPLSRALFSTETSTMESYLRFMKALEAASASMMKARAAIEARSSERVIIKARVEKDLSEALPLTSIKLAPQDTIPFPGHPAQFELASDTTEGLVRELHMISTRNNSLISTLTFKHTPKNSFNMIDLTCRGECEEMVNANASELKSYLTSYGIEYMEEERKFVIFSRFDVRNLFALLAKNQEFPDGVFAIMRHSIIERCRLKADDFSKYSGIKT